MSHPRVFIIAASADIGAHLTVRYLKSGSEVVGTYRHRTARIAELEQAGAVLFQVDLNSREEVAGLAEKLRQSGYEWDVLISAVGLLSPIGPFFSTDFEQWENSVITNSTSQLRMLHAVASLRRRDQLAKVIFFAGGGTNGPFDNYSAYCLGKLSLIKMTELLDSEYPDLQVSIIGTGWVNTKIHQQTIAAGSAAGPNFSRTQEFMAGNTGNAGAASLEDVAECIDWCLRAPRAAVGGRNFSLVHDKWRETGFIDTLINNPSSYKLRRLS
jgi:NAD(P)-dependent dehydrogenase (short-subunit alcohol dehydrogenase family)